VKHDLYVIDDTCYLYVTYETLYVTEIYLNQMYMNDPI